MAGLGPPELIIILVVLLLLFGAKRLPDLAGSLGRSAREFRRAQRHDPDPHDDEPARGTTSTAA